eukprot:maker-scaffold415_size178368-snap-gene-0.24 protein:Tk01171 transcript:maker-scaffold415_size178368-snap-gene-0.24-mRNA-1 annotation:"hypothetical protein Y032_0655g1201"
MIAKLFKATVSRATVFRTIKAFKETGINSRKVQVRGKTVRTSSMKKRIREKIRTNPTRSIRQMAKEEAVTTTSMWRLVRNDLGMFPFKKRSRQLLSEATKKKRLVRGREILQHLCQDRPPPVLWTDEKVFTVQAIHNSQNDRVLARRKTDIPVELRTSFRRQKPPSVMVWAGVTTNGKKTPLIFIEEGVKVNQAVYLHLLFTGSCGSTFSENCTYFENAGGQPGSCSLKVCRSSDNICQLRLDFNMFVVTGPSTAIASVAKAINGVPVTDILQGISVSVASQCLTDTFSVTSPGFQSPPVICGSNNGEHMYVDASELCNTLNFQLGTAGVGANLANRQWSIKITQYSCDFTNLAPQGCTQYFFGPDTDTVQTFNFAGGQHLAGQDQSICVRRERNNCRICWTAAVDTDFVLSGKTNAVQKKVTSSVCCGYGNQGLATDGFDCLNIPGALNPANMLIAGDTIPFNIRFLSDQYEFTGVMAEANKLDKGFKLIYTQTNTGC